MNFKPLLSPNEDPLSYPEFFEKLQYPYLCSPKYDGIRAIVKNRSVFSRSGKLLPSYQVQEEFGIRELNHCDGELIEGCATDFGVYNRTLSHIMSEDKPGEISYFVFDFTDPYYLNLPFYKRLQKLSDLNLPNVKAVFHHEVNSYEELLEYEARQLELGYEGIMLRNPIATYKNGRATFRQNIIYKLKRFQDDEAIILDIYEEMANHNTLEKDELGYAKRSDKKEFKVPSGKAGGFVVSWNGLELDVAPGAFTHLERKGLWQSKDKFIGSLLKFRFMLHGMKDKPRFPRALGLRNSIDL